jgi:AcrR family transcriptional regulator
MGRDERRADLLAAAARAVAARPGERLTFEAIAAEARVSATLPYKYFDSPEDVALELYSTAVADVDARTDELLADTDRAFDDKVRDTIWLWCILVERDEFLFVRLAEGANAASLDRAVRRRRERAVVVWADQIRAEFGIDDATARVLAASVTAGASAVVQRIFADGLDRNDTADLFVRVVRAQCEAAR